MTTSTAEPDVIARAGACSSSVTPQVSMPVFLQPEQMGSPTGATEVAFSSLESLPVEIQTVILAELPLDSLRALINSSSRLYQVYYHNRPSILNKSLKYTLGGIFQDAYAACWSESWFTGLDCAVEQFSSEDYLERLHVDPSGSAAQDLSLAVAHKMAYFHMRVVEPLTDYYARWALGALSSSPEAGPLTGTEKARIQRALYRLQIICNMRLRGPQHILDALDDFGPWQAEEILCVHEFAKERYMSVFIECAYHRISILRNEDVTTVYSCDGVNERLLDSILSLGLEVLRDLVQAKDNEESAVIVDYNLKFGHWLYEDDWIDGAVLAGGYPQHDRRWEAYSEHDEAQDRRQKIEFEQDDLFSPPLAWVTFWDGRYSNLIGIHVPHALYRWGYVIWDAKRLGDSGAMEYLKLEWQCKYGVRGSPEDDDPRENYCSGYQGNAVSS